MCEKQRMRECRCGISTTRLVIRADAPTPRISSLQASKPPATATLNSSAWAATTSRSSAQTFATGYDKGKSDAVKQQYWLGESMQKQHIQVGSVRLYPVQLP